jgi:hypothetical protein
MMLGRWNITCVDPTLSRLAHRHDTGVMELQLAVGIASGGGAAANTLPHVWQSLSRN